MLKFSSGSSVQSVIDALTDLERTQVPFALAKALTETAGQLRDDVRDGLPDRFTIRRPWVPKGIRLRSATKKRLEALVFTKDWFMRDQEEGRDRTGRGGHGIFIPTLAVRDGGALSGEISRANRPRALMRAAGKAQSGGKRPYRKRGGDGAYASPKAFIAHTATGKKALFIRRQADQRLPITMLYVIADDVHVPPRWGFEASTTRVSDKKLRAAFIEALSAALSSAKGGAISSAYVDELLRDVRAGGGFDAYHGGASGVNELSAGVLSTMDR